MLKQAKNSDWPVAPKYFMNHDNIGQYNHTIQTASSEVKVLARDMVSKIPFKFLNLQVYVVLGSYS